jgi:hypothetical protein
MDKPIDRPQILLHSTTLGKNLDEAEQALIMAQAPLYQMKGNLVHVIRLDHEEDSGDAPARRQQGALNIRTVRPQRIVELMLDSADFFVFVKNAWRPGAPSVAFAQAYLARGEWKLRVLRGIIEAPTLRQDGTVLSEPGYDEISQVYLDTGGVEFPDIPDEPTRQEASDALFTLTDIIKDFPFVPNEVLNEFGGQESSARSVALSAMLTGVCRKALRTAPAHAIDATTMATGKTLLCDVIGMLATGRSAASISQGQTREEFNKRLFSVLLQGDPVVVIDNIDQDVASDEFCTVLTAPEWQNRVLGESETRVVPTNVLFLPNGNNIRFKGDMVTRVIVCRMDAGMENPGARKFDRDLRAYVPENRPQLVVAALTVLRAYVVAGRPGSRDLEPFARFEDWSNLVRGALVWLGEPDPLSTREAIVAIDPERENLAALLRAWEAAIGIDKWVLAKDVVEISEQRGDDLVGRKAGEDLYEALDALFGPRDISINTLGRYLVQFDGRIVDGKCLRKHAVNGKSTRFRLEAAA